MKRLLVLMVICAPAVLLIRTAGSVSAGGPVNDNFANALTVNEDPYTNKQLTTSAANEGNDPNIGACSFGSAGYSHSIWYQYTPASDRTVDVNTNGSGLPDTVLAAFTGTKGNLTQVACDDDSGTGLQSALKFQVQGGVTYYFLAATWNSGGAGGNLLFNFSSRDAQEPIIFEADKCYQARIAKRSARFQRQDVTTYDPNFGIESTSTVLALALYCNPADQELPGSGGVAGDEPDVPLEDIRQTCYAIRDSEQHRPENIFVRTKIAETALSVGKAESICVLALKDSGQLPDFGELEGRILKCYSARLAKGSPRFERVDLLLADQFSQGFKNASALRPVSFCNFAEKLTLDPNGGSAGPAEEIDEDLNSVVCYALRQPSFQAFNIPLIDQFLDRQFVDPLVSIRKADRMCVLAAKKEVAPNDRIENATKIHPECDVSCFYSDHVGTTTATKSRNDPVIRNCEFIADGFDYGRSVWYTYTPGFGENLVEISTENSTYDTVLAVYTGSKGNLTQVACNDDDEDLTSLVEFEAEYGQKYHIMVGAYGNGNAGKLKFQLFVPCLTKLCPQPDTVLLGTPERPPSAPKKKVS